MLRTRWCGSSGFPRFSPDGKWLAAAHGSWEAREGGEARVWDAKTGKPKFVVTADRGIRSVGWDPKGKTVAAGGYAGVLRFYDAETGDPTGQTKNLSENPR